MNYYRIQSDERGPKKKSTRGRAGEVVVLITFAE